MEVQDNGIKIDGVFIRFTEDQINAIKCAKNPEKNRLNELGFYEPENDEYRHYWLTVCNGILDGSYDGDFELVKAKNSFPSQEAAKKEQRRREIFNDMLKSSCEFRKGCMSIYFNHECNTYCIGTKITTQELGTIYFPSKEIAQSLIDKYGEELHLLRY